MRRSISFLLGILLAISLGYAITLQPIGDKIVHENATLVIKLNATGNYSPIIYGIDTNASGYSFDVNSGIFNWTPSFDAAGVYYANFTARESANASDYDYKVITITVLNTDRQPVITSQPKTEAYVNKTYSYDVEATDPDGDVLEYSLVEKPAGMTINATTGLITWDGPSQPQTVQVSVMAYEKNDPSVYAIQQYTLKVLEPPSRLRVIDGKVEVNGYKDYYKTLSTEGGTTFSAYPGDSITLKLDIEDFYDSNIFDEELDFENVYFELTIKNFEGEGDEDLEVESDEKTIRAGDDRTLYVDFKVPYAIEERDYDVDIKIYAEDENNNHYFKELSYTLQIKKQRHALLLKGVDLFPDKIYAGEPSKVSVMATIQNIGGRDEDNVMLKVVSPDTDQFNYIETGIELSSDPYDKDSRYFLDKTFDVLINESGSYKVIIQAEIPDEDVRVYRTFNLEVAERPHQTTTTNTINYINNTNSQENQENTTTEVIFPTPEQNTEEENVTSQQEQQEIIRETPFTETPMFIGILIGILGLLVVIFILMLIVLIKK